MAKIQLKKSVIVDDEGKAKEPTSEQMEYGELAVNFNEIDPAIFLKDSDDKIIRIAGLNASGSASPGVNEDITALKNLSTPITLAQGGTGADDAEEGLSNLKGIKEVKNVGSTGQSLVVAESTNDNSASYRAELKSITAKNNGGIAVTTVGKTVEVRSIPEEILGTLPEDGVIDINKTLFKNAAAPKDPQDLATRKYVDDVSVTTNLSLSKDANTVTVKSSTGADTTISTATNTSAGVLTASDYVRLDDLADGRNNSYLAKNGKADTAGVADNSLKLGGKAPSEYLTQTEKAATAALADNSKALGDKLPDAYLLKTEKSSTAALADNSLKLGNKEPSEYMLKSEVPSTAENSLKLGGTDASSYLLKTEKAATAGTADNSLQLGGLSSGSFLRSNGKALTAGTADNSNKLDGLSSGSFLRSNGKAADSDKLDGLNSTDFLRSDGKASTCGRADIASNSDKLGGKAASTYTTETSGTFICQKPNVKGQKLKYTRLGKICCISGRLSVRPLAGQHSRSFIEFDLPFVPDDDFIGPLLTDNYATASIAGHVKAESGRGIFKVWLLSVQSPSSNKLYNPVTHEALTPKWFSDNREVYKDVIFTLTYRCRN